MTTVARSLRNGVHDPACRDIVFLGPSLARAEAETLLPAGILLPPIEHGDLLRLDLAAGDRVLIVDGLFMHAAPVRHREILALLERGVVVAGAGSMGALRAAELHPFGMRGVGEIFDLYRRGIVTGDDEVAVVHGPAEEGYRSLSEPLVNMRIALRAAADAAAISSGEADQLLALARAMPFRRRGYRALEQLARAELTDGSIDRFLAWLAEHPHDAKASDARLLLSMAALDDRLLQPHDDRDAPIENVNTAYFARWVARHQGWTVDGRWVTDTEVAGALMLLHPDYPELHRRDVLQRLLGETRWDATSAQRAVALARSRGISDDPRDDPAGRWLTAAERDLPPDEAIIRVLVRAFGTAGHRRVAVRRLPPELATQPALARARRFVAAALNLTERTLPPVDPASPRRRLRFRDDIVDRYYRRLWGGETGDLAAAVWDRGLTDTESLRRLGEPFLLYCRTLGVPDFSAATSSRSSGPAGSPAGSRHTLLGSR